VSGPRTVAEWNRAAALASAELDSFDRRWTGVVFRSKDHNRHELVAALEDARLGLLRAIHEAEDLTAPEPSPDPMTARAREALAKLPAVLADLKGQHARITRSAIARGLYVDRGTFVAWIVKGWVNWPPSD
jgi:hypothetical protein